MKGHRGGGKGKGSSFGHQSKRKQDREYSKNIPSVENLEYGKEIEKEVQEDEERLDHNKLGIEATEYDDNDAGDDLLDDEDQRLEEIQTRKTLSVRVFLWEFGQNDPKRDSGSKMCRFGLAKKLKVGQNFGGIVLSSEATKVMSPEDYDIIAQHGIAGINCSWNRLEEIPFRSLGKSSNQRKLPLIVAANTVNYGKPFKMNTAEAIAAGLYIAGFKSDAITLMYPFSFGSEFLRLNEGALEAYSSCTNEFQVQAIMDDYLSESAEKAKEKEARKLQSKSTSNNIGGYMDDMDLPPMDSEDEYEYEDEVVEG